MSPAPARFGPGPSPHPRPWTDAPEPIPLSPGSAPFPRMRNVRLGVNFLLTMLAEPCPRETRLKDAAAVTHFAKQQPDELPLVSAAFLTRTAIAIGILVALTIVISIAGRWLGERIALAGHTDSIEAVSIGIGEDRITLPANVIRFERQRRSGPAERVDLYATWPEMAGYGAENRKRFSDIRLSAGLLFMQISQSTMSRDMSGRLEPIYSHLFDGEGQAYNYGLTLHRMRKETGYGDEVFFTAPRPGKPDYVVRCLLPRAAEDSTTGDCQRDIHIGRDLSVLYRFSSTHLSEWQHIDDEIARFLEARLDPAG